MGNSILLNSAGKLWSSSLDRPFDCKCVTEFKVRMPH
jgi:hypothetical protein